MNGDFAGEFMEYVEKMRSLGELDVIIVPRMYYNRYKDSGLFEGLRIRVVEDNHMLNETVIRRYVRVQGMTVEEFAEYLDTSVNRMYRILNGSTIPNVSEGMKIALYLQCPIEDLWDITGVKR